MRVGDGRKARLYVSFFADPCFAVERGDGLVFVFYQGDARAAVIAFEPRSTAPGDRWNLDGMVVADSPLAFRRASLAEIRWLIDEIRTMPDRKFRRLCVPTIDVGFFTYRPGKATALRRASAGRAAETRVLRCRVEVAMLHKSLKHYAIVAALVVLSIAMVRLVAFVLTMFDALPGAGFMNAMVRMNESRTPVNAAVLNASLEVSAWFSVIESAVAGLLAGLLRGRLRSMGPAERSLVAAGCAVFLFFEPYEPHVLAFSAVLFLACFLGGASMTARAPRESAVTLTQPPGSAPPRLRPAI